MSADKEILLTGASGYLGSGLAKDLLKNTDYSLRLVFRAGNAYELETKKNSFLEVTDLQDLQERINFVGGDITDENLYHQLDPRKIALIVHSAAVTRFNVDSKTADEVNVRGTQAIIDFANKCSNLEQLALLSTVYVAGLKTGFIDENPLDNEAGFSNEYERSKWQAEQLLVNNEAALPWSIYRISTAIADNDSGKVKQLNAFHNTLKLFYYGLLSLFPGEPEATLYFVTGDFAVKAVSTALCSGKASGIYHVCHEQQESINLKDLIDTVFEEFSRHGNFKSRRVLKPLFADAESFELLTAGVNSLNAGVVSQALSSVSPFSRQLFANKQFTNTRLRSIYSDYKSPDPKTLIAKAASYLVNTRWGKAVEHAV